MRRPDPSAELSPPLAAPPGAEAGTLGGAAVALGSAAVALGGAASTLGDEGGAPGSESGAPGGEANPSRGLKVAAVALAIVGLVAAQRAGLFSLFAEPARVKQALVALGPWGYAAFVAAYAALQPFGVPGTAFIVAAPLIWPWPVAFALSMVGTMAASVVGFSFARFVARDWVSRRVPARFRAHDRALAERGFATVFALRFIFWMPPMLHAFFGVSRVRFWTHFWGSAAGYLVPLLATAYFGEKMFDAMRAAPPSVWAGLGAATAASLVIAWFFRRRAKRARAADLER